MQNTSKAMVAHLGSDVTEPEAMLIRRIAVFESEMQLMELQIAKDRHFNVEPSDKFLDLYSGLVNSQRRLLETVGMKRVAKDVTPDLESYLKRTHET